MTKQGTVGPHRAGPPPRQALGIMMGSEKYATYHAAAQLLRRSAVYMSDEQKFEWKVEQAEAAMARVI